TWLGDFDTSVKRDANLAIQTNTGIDTLRFYDLDSLGIGFVSDSILNLPTPAEGGPSSINANMPWGWWEAGAADGKGNMVVVSVANQDLPSIEVGVIDPTRRRFFPVKTDLVQATGGKIDPPGVFPTCLARFAENEYWLLISEGDPSANNDDAGAQSIYRL